MAIYFDGSNYYGCGSVERINNSLEWPFINVVTIYKDMPSVNQVIFNGKTTIVFWNDHTKTVVKCQDGDTFSEEAGIALCFMKKMLGNKGNYNKVLREALEKAKRQVAD